MIKFPDMIWQNSLTRVKCPKFPDIFLKFPDFSLTWRKFRFPLTFPWHVATLQHVWTLWSIYKLILHGAGTGTGTGNNRRQRVLVPVPVSDQCKQFCIIYIPIPVSVPVLFPFPCSVNVQLEGKWFLVGTRIRWKVSKLFKVFLEIGVMFRAWISLSSLFSLHDRNLVLCAKLYNVP